MRRLIRILLPFALAILATGTLAAPESVDDAPSMPAAITAASQRLYTLAANTLVPVRTNGADRIAVLYPDLDEPYRSVFRQILAGIERSAPARVVGIRLNDAMSPKQLTAELREQRVGVVIALGRHGLQAASALPRDIPVVGGAVLASPADGAGTGALVSLTPDPRLLLQHLKRLAPSVRRVFTVYSARQNDWLMALARHAAKAQGVELVEIETDDLRVALKRFHEITATAEPGRDAIWLPQDSAVLDDQVVLPFVLQQAWDRSIIVFSSTLAHVRRGALFALYPDNEDMGRQLTASALDLLEHPTGPHAVQPLREVRLALNTRTARHLGVNLETVEKDVVLLFPVR